MITINMEKAVEIKKDILRRQRAELFATLDVDFMKAMESGDTAAQQEIAAKKEILRNITDKPELANATTVEQLDAVTIESALNEE
jgi:hypothetical protein